ncbi:MAG: hypothetical protein MMC33_009875, partial [Icmadophila ericetorum]|nr:hypothetical protein [Icmadophila ericetorum]
MEAMAKGKVEEVYMPMSELWREGVIVSVLKDWTCKSAGLVSLWDDQEILLKYSHDVARASQGPLDQSSEREFRARERFLGLVASYLRAHTSYADSELYDHLHCALHSYYLRKRDLGPSLAAQSDQYDADNIDSSRKRRRTEGFFQYQSKSSSVQTDDNIESSTQDSAFGVSSPEKAALAPGSRYSRSHIQNFPRDWTLEYPAREREVPLSQRWGCDLALPSASRWTWPKTELPVEIFELIASFLPREDIQSMRLVSRHFEKNISLPMFRTVVVPFRSELQDLMLGSKGFGNTSKDESKRVAEKENVDILTQLLVTEPLPNGLLVQSVSLENLDRGMRVFQGWGPHIRRIAMAFELNEDVLVKIRTKRTQEVHSSFWGDYVWPCPEYNRFPSIESLEKAADKSKDISKAFSYLEGVCELALSLDSGLGWLQGPDISSRAKHFKTKPAIFGRQNCNPNSADELRMISWKRFSTQPKELLWLVCELVADVRLDQVALCRYMELLMDCKLFDVSSLSLIAYYMRTNPIGRIDWLTSDTLDGYVLNFMIRAGQLGNEESRKFCTIQHLLRKVQSLSSSYLMYQPTPRPAPSPLEITRMRQEGTRWAGNDQEAEDSELEDRLALPLTFEGVTYGTVGDAAALEYSYERNSSNKADRCLTVRPNALTISQKEYLLETGWAQSAFVHSYILALMDNSATFASVQTFTFSRLSSCFLPTIDRADLWDSLPNVHTVNLNISPDWRRIVKTPNGVIEYDFHPSVVAKQVCTLIYKQMYQRQAIKTLKIGYVGGGEHARGYFARNQHILPAPIMDNRVGKILIFPFIRSLTFTNCWFMPDILAQMIQSLKTCVELNLQSVSLVAQGGYPNANQANGVGNWEREISQLPPSSQTGLFKIGRGFGVPVSTEPQRDPQFFLLNPAHYDGIPHGTGYFAQMEALTRPFARPHVEPNPPDDLWTNLDWLKFNPPPGTWAYVLEQVSPGASIALVRHIRDDGPESRPRAASPLHRITFDSCGYVKLPFQVFTPAYLFTDYRRNPMTDYGSEIAQHTCMLTSKDPFLGEIIPKIHPKEEMLLRYVFGMELGWRGAKQFEPREDQRTFGGTGRFTGVLEK